MGDKLIFAGGIISAIALFHFFTGVIIGSFFDSYEKNEHNVHIKFLLYGALSFSKKIRHKHICDKCF